MIYRKFKLIRGYHHKQIENASFIFTITVTTWNPLVHLGHAWSRLHTIWGKIGLVTLLFFYILIPLLHFYHGSIG
jgi:hypothetical protein